ncbi:MAG: murein biosynthesis integral membrane protein MurJ [Pseudomonadota bacterium]
MKLLRSMTTVGGFTIGSRVGGFARDILIAFLLGAGPAMDALVVAIKLPSLFRRLLAEGALNASFIPLFAGIARTQGKQKAKEFAEDIFSILLVILIIFVVATVALMPWILPICAPGFRHTPERLQLAIQFSQITFPFIFFISLTALYGGILNSFERFAAVAASPMAGNIFILLLSISLYPLFQQPGIILSLSILGCGLIQLMWVSVPCYRLGFNLKPRRPRLTPHVIKFLARMGPAGLGSGVHQINIVIATLIASVLPIGGMSYLYYAERLTQLPLSVIGTAMSTVLLPLLSKQWRAGEFDNARDSQNQGIEYALLITMPATVGLVFLAQPIISTLFEHGRFDPQSSQATANALMALAWGLPAYVLTKILNTSFYAQENTTTPVIFAGISVAVDIALSLLLIRSFHHVGIALATASAAWVNVVLLATALRKRKFLVFTPKLKRFAVNLVITCIGLSTYLEVAKYLVMPWMAYNWPLRLFGLMVLVGGGVCVYTLLGYMTKLFDFRELKVQFQRN